jgi:selenocysteine lyase/cysteine desulfurase
MEALVDTEAGLPDAFQAESIAGPVSQALTEPAAFAELERGVYAALETYSNVHRGSGHYSLATTHLYEQAREIVLEHLGLDKDKYAVIFCTPARLEALAAQVRPGSYRVVSSRDIGLPLGVRALVVERAALPGGAPVTPGGGTARLVAPGWVIWARTPDKFEPGTPAIANVIAFAVALRLLRQHGDDAFRGGPATAAPAETRSVADILHHDAFAHLSGHNLLDALRATLIGRGLQVPTAAGLRPFINLDNAASTPTFAPIWDAFRLALPQPAPVQREIIREVRAICAGFLGAPAADYDVLFTANTTEAINLVAESLRRESESGVEPVVVNTLLEHNSNELAWRNLPGVALIRLPIDDEGFVDPNALEALLSEYNREGRQGNKRIRLVAVSGASNVLATFNDLAEIGGIAHRYGALLLVDAAQLVAHRPTEMAAWEIDYLAFSAHKVYAPFGSGALVARKGLLHFDGAETEQIRASGEENAAGIAALGKALVLLGRIGMDVIQAEEQALTARALRGMAQISGITVFGVKDPDSPGFARKGGVIAFDVKGAISGRVAGELAARGGIGVRYGCHCAHLTVKRILHVPPWAEELQRVMLTVLPRLSLPGVVRASLGIENTEADVDALLRVLGDIARQPKANAARGLRPQMDDFVAAAARRVYAPA